LLKSGIPERFGLAPSPYPPSWTTAPEPNSNSGFWYNSAMGASRTAGWAVLLILLFLVLHPVIHHDHPEWLFGSKVDTAMHQEDRKWLLALLLAPALAAAWLLGDQGARFSSAFRQYESESYSREGHFLQSALSRGILHSRIYA
jgi:hypothetical protein